MVSYFLRWTLLIFLDSIPDEQSHKVVRQLGESHAQWLINQMKSSAGYCGNFEFKTFLWEI